MTEAEYDWEAIEGLVIAPDLDPAELGRKLAERGVVAQLDWMDRSPWLVGLKAAADADRAIALLDADGSTLKPGPALKELAEELAAELNGEVRIGEAAADHLPKDADLVPADAKGDDVASRAVEISKTPASSIPLIAAMEGMDIGQRELTAGYRALLAKLPASRRGWNFGDLPLVSLTNAGGDFQARCVVDDHTESIVTYDWALNRELVPGYAAADKVEAHILDLVGDRLNIQTICDHVPGADADAAWAAASKKGPEAIDAFVAALGLDPKVGEFLAAKCEIEDVPEVTVHLARGISNAIGRSVDIMMSEPDSKAYPIWETYRETVVEKPWLPRIIATVEAAVGAGLLANGIKGGSSRPGLSKVGGVIGGFLLFDSVAEISLAKLLRIKEGRSAGPVPEDDSSYL